MAHSKWRLINFPSSLCFTTMPFRYSKKLSIMYYHMFSIFSKLNFNAFVEQNMEMAGQVDYLLYSHALVGIRIVTEPSIPIFPLSFFLATEFPHAKKGNWGTGPKVWAARVGKLELQHILLLAQWRNLCMCLLPFDPLPFDPLSSHKICLFLWAPQRWRNLRLKKSASLGQVLITLSSSTNLCLPSFTAEQQAAKPVNSGNRITTTPCAWHFSE